MGADASSTPRYSPRGEDYPPSSRWSARCSPSPFGDGALLCSDELHDASLICAGEGPTAYAMARSELEFYFGGELVAELDALAGPSAAARES
jgi:hypothetical protein